MGEEKKMEERKREEKHKRCFTRNRTQLLSRGRSKPRLLRCMHVIMSRISIAMS